MTHRVTYFAVLLLAAPAAAQPLQAPLAEQGEIPVWLAAGPFEQPTVGFGDPADVDLIGESDVQPREGDVVRSDWADGGAVAWRPIAPNPDGFTDFHAAFAGVAPGDGPERIWWAKAGYAFTTIHSPREQEATLLMGSNSHLKVLLNGQVVHTAYRERNAVADEDRIQVRLQPGENTLLVRVGQTHRNEAIQFFLPLEWQWGFYARLLDANGDPADVRAALDLSDTPLEPSIASSFFFRKEGSKLLQRFDLTLSRHDVEPVSGEVGVSVDGSETSIPLNHVSFGLSHHALWLPAVDEPTAATIDLRMGDRAPTRWEAILEPQPRYELHLMLTSHTDVGYTHPQPTVAERHALLLDDVIARAEAEPDFRWTIETIWALEQFVEHRADDDIERLMRLIRNGRVAVSPIYGNPFTGWVSEEELVRSFTPGREYADRFGFDFHAALFNDEPGFSWGLPRRLLDSGATFFVAGLNEVYNDYAFQRTLPKVFRWEGGDGSTVVTYLTEAYNEGQTYGMVKGVAAMEDRMRERLQRLRTRGYDHDLVLLNTTLGDNGPVPTAELESARAWNEQYAYPRIVVSDLNLFADAFMARYGDDLPTIRGDWTSTWSTLGQGELARVVRQRWAQHHLPLAEAMSTAAWLSDGRQSLQSLIDDAYHSLKQYSAHGSGLEYGYGSPEENAITMAYREQYVQNGFLTTEEALQRAARRLVQPMEAFDMEGLFVFNGLEVGRDAPLEVEFPREAGRRFRVVDLATGGELPSHQDSHILRFVVRDLPAVGYRKLRLEPRTEEAPGSDLVDADFQIENAYWRLRLDPTTGALSSLVEKGTGRELVRPGASLPFGVPARSLMGNAAGFVPLSTRGVSVILRDERPVRLQLVATYPGQVVRAVTYTVWDGIDRVDVQTEVDLEALEPVAATEEYGLPFPFALDQPSVQVGLLGGFADPAEDRFRGIDHDAFSLRQSLALSDAEGSVSWAAVDSRVVRLREVEGEAAPTLIATLANHFPESWNRNEKNRGVWPLRFALTYRGGPFDAGFTDRFGRELAQEPRTVHTWLTTDGPVRSFLDVSGAPVHLQAYKTADGGMLVRLRNPDSREPAAVTVGIPGRELASAELLSILGTSAEPLSVDRSGVAVTLGPSEDITVRLRLDGLGSVRPSHSPSPTTQEVVP